MVILFNSVTFVDILVCALPVVSPPSAEVNNQKQSKNLSYNSTYGSASKYVLTNDRDHKCFFLNFAILLACKVVISIVNP